LCPVQISHPNLPHVTIGSDGGQLSEREQRLVGTHLACLPPLRRQLLPQREDLFGWPDERRAGTTVPQRAVRELAQLTGIAHQRDQVRARETQPAQPFTPPGEPVDRPQFPSETARRKPGRLNLRGDHTAADRIRGERGIHRRSIPVIKQPCTSKPQHSTQRARSHRETKNYPLTVTAGSPSPVSMPLSSAIRDASSINVSPICASGTVLMTSPLTKICPLPFPEATPRSASRASPGPFTTHPITATRSGTSIPSSP